jgi:hypothetical protein
MSSSLSWPAPRALREQEERLTAPKQSNLLTLDKLVCYMPFS